MSRTLGDMGAAPRSGQEGEHPSNSESRRLTSPFLCPRIKFIILNVIHRPTLKPFEAEAHFFKLLVHPARLEILTELRQEEACVCHLEAKLGYRQAYISQHLMVLREAGVLQDRREGWNIFYRVIKPEIFQVMDTVSRLLKPVAKARATSRAPKTPCQCPKCNPGDATSPGSPALVRLKERKVSDS